MRNKTTRIDSTALGRLGDQAHFGYSTLSHVAQIHHWPRLKADGFDTLLELGICVEVGAGFAPRAA